MTFMLILGGVAACYLVWLLFRLAVFALPAYAGAAAFVVMLDRGFGPGAAIAAGLAVGLLLVVGSRWVHARASIPGRLLVQAAFAMPAAAAGYQAARAVAELALPASILVPLLGAGAAVAAAAASWRSISAAPLPRDPVDGPAEEAR